MEKQAQAHNCQTRHFYQPIIFLTKELKLNLEKDFLFPHPSPHNCLISDVPHVGIMGSWPITLKVDFLQFEGHLSVSEVEKQNADKRYTRQDYLNQSNGFD